MSLCKTLVENGNQHAPDINAGEKSQDAKRGLCSCEVAFDRWS
jgi:hypothetical protein